LKNIYWVSLDVPGARDTQVKSWSSSLSSQSLHFTRERQYSEEGIKIDTADEAVWQEIGSWNGE
jgi:hypothetical protein